MILMSFRDIVYVQYNGLYMIPLVWINKIILCKDHVVKLYSHLSSCFIINLNLNINTNLSIWPFCGVFGLRVIMIILNESYALLHDLMVAGAVDMEMYDVLMVKMIGMYEYPIYVKL